jgi:hypothetical protein
VFRINVDYNFRVEEYAKQETKMTHAPSSVSVDCHQSARRYITEDITLQFNTSSALRDPIRQ